jgi:tetratricopeptide (TPR) repeat protein
MNAFRAMGCGRVAGTLLVGIGVLLWLPTAKADDWQVCIAAQPDTALAACSAVIAQHERGDAELSRAYVILGEWHRLRNRNDEALSDFDQALKLDPKSYNATAGRGATLGQKGQGEEALAHFERAIVLDPQNPYGYILRGQWRQRRNQFADAMADFDRAISLRSDVAIHGCGGAACSIRWATSIGQCRTSTARSRSIRASPRHSTNAATFIAKRASLIVL